MPIDVMMPFYGDVAQFRQAVTSVLGQRDGDLRLVVVDDCYPDPAPGEWLESLDDPRVRYLRNETNLGVNGNFRRCVELVEADYFVVVGCDDVMTPDYLTTVRGLADGHPEAAVIAPGVEVIDDRDRVVRPLGDRIKALLAPRARPGEPVVLRGEVMATGLYHGNWTYFPSLLWRTAAVRDVGFRPGLEIVLDLALLVDLAAVGRSLVYDPTVVFRYRRHDASVSSVHAVDGRRFAEENAFFAVEARRCAARGWPRAARAARLHATSRLNHAQSRVATTAGRLRNANPNP
ncbi:glycosyltransferase family 2 protein [Gordonia rhizosphera]|uniref:Putative glycosyltransferase n=1 Tax=Gordonia rhizosphera NBRC 16068 TaxID=1108045 RepID=K6W6H3_9ACTN|nr:glycosyltransferase family 2 protein [Gordonia rhizosphera]GAB89291.1 putative glycosyltransferase [Gordonia rhizosphera NBRC 16068]